MGRITSFTCTLAQGTASSTIPAWPIVRKRRLTAGRRCSRFSRRILKHLEGGDKKMCTGIVETAEVSGSDKGPRGWFKLEQVNVSYDHPSDAPLEHALNIDFVNQNESPSARVAVELDPASARKLVEAILAALSRGEA